MNASARALARVGKTTMGSDTIVLLGVLSVGACVLCCVLGCLTVWAVRMARGRSTYTVIPTHIASPSPPARKPPAYAAAAAAPEGERGARRTRMATGGRVIASV